MNPPSATTQPRPRTAPAALALDASIQRSNAQIQRSPRRQARPATARPAVAAIAEAEVSIPQNLARTQRRRSGGWFRRSRDRPITEAPVAEIVPSAETPVAQVVERNSFRRERDGSLSYYPEATCVGGDSPALADARAVARAVAAGAPNPLDNPALPDARAAAASAPPSLSAPDPLAAARQASPAATPEPQAVAVARDAAAPAPATASRPGVDWNLNGTVDEPGVALPGLTAPPPPLSPATVDRHVASPPSPSLAPIAAAPVAAPPLADGASNRWATARDAELASPALVTPDSPPRAPATVRELVTPPESPPLLTPGLAAAAAFAPAPPDPVLARLQATEQACARERQDRHRAERERAHMEHEAAVTPTGPLTEARCAQLAALARSAAAPAARTGALKLLGAAARDLGRKPAAAALALALQSALFAADARVRIEALRTAAACGLLEVARSVRGDDDAAVRREAARLLAAGAFGAEDVFRNDATTRRTFQAVAALSSALRDAAIDEPGLVGRLEEALIRTGVTAEELLEAPLERTLERHPSAAVRAAAAAAAGALGCCQCLRRVWLVQPADTAVRVRVAACAALARNGCGRDLRELVLTDAASECRKAAYEWLARLDDADALAEKGLHDTDVELRGLAAALIADVMLRRASNAAPTWQWRADEFPRPQPPAPDPAPLQLEACTADGFEAAASALIQAAQGDAAEAVRGAALESLGRLTCVTGVAVGLGDSAEAVRLRAVALLQHLGGDEVAAALEQALSDASYASVRAAAAEAIGALVKRDQGTFDGTSLRHIIASRLGDAERSVRSAAARALDVVEGGDWSSIVRGDAGDVARIHHTPGPRATAVLVSLLCDAAEVQDRVSAAVALGGRTYDGAIPPLVVDALCACCAARGSLPAPLRVACLDALAALSVTSVALSGSDQVDVACAHALEDTESTDVRRAAALCAGAAKCLCRGRLVHGVGEDPAAAVRVACVQSLREFASEQGAAWALVAALGDAEAAVRETASLSFDGFAGAASAAFRPLVARAVCARVLDRSAVEVNDEQTKRAAACRALRHLDDAADATLDALHDALKNDRNVFTRREACRALGALKHPRSLRALAGALRDRRDADLPGLAREAILGLDYGRGGLLRPNERALFTGPVLKRQDRMVTRTRLKALVLTDQPRLFYCDADGANPKSCDVASLAADGADLSVVVEGGQGRVRLAPVFGEAREWLEARDASARTSEASAPVASWASEAPAPVAEFAPALPPRAPSAPTAPAPSPTWGAAAAVPVRCTF